MGEGVEERREDDGDVMGRLVIYKGQLIRHEYLCKCKYMDDKWAIEYFQMVMLISYYVLSETILLGLL